MSFLRAYVKMTFSSPAGFFIGALFALMVGLPLYLVIERAHENYRYFGTIFGPSHYSDDDPPCMRGRYGDC